MKAKMNWLFLSLLVGVLTVSLSCGDSDDDVLSSDAEIVEFSFPEQTSPASINSDDAEVNIEVIYQTDLTMLTPSMQVSEGATFDEDVTSAPGDYSSAVSIPVTAEDGTVKDWLITVSEEPRPPYSATDILTFALEEQTSSANLDYEDHRVEVEVVEGTDLTTLTPRFRVSPGATSVPESADPTDYSDDGTITVTAEDGITLQDWTVSVTVASGEVSSEADILSFAIPEQTFEPIINPDFLKVTVEVAHGTDLSRLIPTFSISPGATAVPPSETEMDFTSDQMIRVTAEDGENFKDWRIHVYAAPEEDDPANWDDQIVEAYSSIFCDEELCALDLQLRQACQEYLIECLTTTPEECYDDCLIAARFLCKE